jgi:non-reducing end alpha-L-arabinofuranosidase
VIDNVTHTESTFEKVRSVSPVKINEFRITLDRPLTKHHAIDAVVNDAQVKTAGYQRPPNQWFGGPALSVSAGSMVLRDAAARVVDSLNYGGLVDPWASEGYQATSGFDKSGCFVALPGFPDMWSPVSTVKTNISVGRFPDGHDEDNNCTDMMTPAASTLATGSYAGATNVKIDTLAGFSVGQTVMIDTGGNLEAAVIAAVGTPGATNSRVSTDKSAIAIFVDKGRNFAVGQTITIDEGATPRPR